MYLFDKDVVFVLGSRVSGAYLGKGLTISWDLRQRETSSNSYKKKKKKKM
jgi:hypothetical protein